MKNRLDTKVSFEMIRYSNCWEDGEVLIKGLNTSPGSKILSVGSAGDNSFSLLTTNPELVIAIDINPCQLYLLELKKLCFRNLSREETMRFLGFNHDYKRLKTYKILRRDLSQAAKDYWDKKDNFIAGGVIHQGKLEKFFHFFSKRILPWIHRKQTIRNLLAKKNEYEQSEFYEKRWNTYWWRQLFKVFFSKYILGKYGRDPHFLNEVKVPVSTFILQKAARQLKSIESQNNYMLQYILTGSYNHLLPHYIRAENYEIIKANLKNLIMIEGYIEKTIDLYGKMDAMNLSNIFEYMNVEDFTHVSKRLIESTVRGGNLAYWNLMVPRSISELHPTCSQYQKELSESLTKKDNGFFYNKFILDEIV